MSPIFMLAVAFAMGICVGSMFMCVFQASKYRRNENK